MIGPKNKPLGARAGMSHGIPCRSMYTLIWFETSVCLQILNEISRLRSPHLLIVSVLLNHSPAFTDPLWFVWDRVHSNVVCENLYILNTVFLLSEAFSHVHVCSACLFTHRSTPLFLGTFYHPLRKANQPSFLSVQWPSPLLGIILEQTHPFGCI